MNGSQSISNQKMLDALAPRTVRSSLIQVARVEDLGDAFLQAGVVDGVIDAPFFFHKEVFDAQLEGFEASHDLVVVVVFW